MNGSKDKQFTETLGIYLLTQQSITSSRLGDKGPNRVGY